MELWWCISHHFFIWFDLPKCCCLAKGYPYGLQDWGSFSGTLLFIPQSLFPNRLAESTGWDCIDSAELCLLAHPSRWKGDSNWQSSASKALGKPLLHYVTDHPSCGCYFNFARPEWLCALRTCARSLHHFKVGTDWVGSCIGFLKNVLNTIYTYTFEGDVIFLLYHMF